MMNKTSKTFTLALNRDCYVGNKKYCKNWVHKVACLLFPFWFTYEVIPGDTVTFGEGIDLCIVSGPKGVWSNKRGWKLLCSKIFGWRYLPIYYEYECELLDYNKI